MSTTAEATNHPARRNTSTTESPSSDRYADAVESVDTAKTVSYADAIQSVDTDVTILEHCRDIGFRRRPVVRFLKSVAVWFGKLFKKAEEEVVDVDEEMESQPEIPWHTGRSSLHDISSAHLQSKTNSASLGVAVMAGQSSSGDIDKMSLVVAWLHDSLEDNSTCEYAVVSQDTANEAEGPWNRQSGVHCDPSIPSPPSSLNDEQHGHVLAPVMLSAITEQDHGFCRENEDGVSYGRCRFRLRKIQNPFGIRQRANLFSRRGGMISRMLRRVAAQQ